MPGPGEDFPLKTELLSLTRRLGLLGLADRFYGARRVAEEREENGRFMEKHPGMVLPPPALIQRTYGTPSFHSFHHWGRSNAKEIAGAIDRHVEAGEPKIAEWGCGLGRIARHLTGRYDYWGFDIDQGSVNWCRENLDGHFVVNRPKPPLPMMGEAFDAVFAVSIFTHLSEKAHRAWRDEILRVLKPGGVFVFTVHGEGEAADLSTREREVFDAGRLVVRGKVREGSRTYLAYHPRAFVEEVLLSGYDKVEGPVPACAQTLYVGRKPLR